MRAAIASRLAECGLELNERKTRIVYCKDSTRRGSHEHESFDFLGYTFRPRLSRGKSGGQFVNFLPAVSDDARKRIGREIRHWRLHVRSGTTLTELARSINVIVRGWSGSSRGAVSALPPVRFPDPPAEPDMRLPPHPALHSTSAGRSQALVRQRRSPARWWPGLFRGPPTARGCAARGSGSPGPRRASEAFCLRGWSSRVPSTVA